MQNYDIGNRIYELRKEKGLSQKELGALIGVSNKAVSKWETGAAAPKTETIIKLASALGVTVEELLSAKQPEIENLNTLDALSDKTAKMFLQNKITGYEQAQSQEKYKSAKAYLICIACLFTVTAVIFAIISYIGNNLYPFLEVDLEAGMSIWEMVSLSIDMAYVICGVYTGITLFVRNIKKLPTWSIALLCVFFPITFLLIEITGTVMVVPQIILSVRTLINKGKDSNG